jgi:integrase
MQIQLWRRKNKEETKHNLYIRYRVNQNRAKVETLKLWEWVNPTEEVQIRHNKSVKKAYEEILRRTKDDIENNRININIKNKKKSTFKDDFIKYSKIDNKEAIYKFIKSQYDDIDNRNTSEINRDYLLSIKEKIETNISEKKIKNATASKYWSDLKKGLRELNEQKLCDYPNLGSIKNSKEKRHQVVLSKNELNKINNIKSKKLIEIKNAFLFASICGIKIRELSKMRWSDIKKEKGGDYALNYKKKQILVSKEIRKIMGKRKSEKKHIFNLPTNKSTTSKIFNKMIKESGLNKKIRMGDAIHTFAHNLYKETKNIYLISSYLEHKSIEITKSKYNYMEEETYLIENNLLRDNSLTRHKFKRGKLFKKGRLLSYKQDTL